MEPSKVDSRLDALEEEGIRNEERWRSQWEKNAIIIDNAKDIAKLNVRMAQIGPYIGLASAVGAMLGGALVMVVVRVIAG